MAIMLMRFWIIDTWEAIEAPPKAIQSSLPVTWKQVIGRKPSIRPRYEICMHMLAGKLTDIAPETVGLEDDSFPFGAVTLPGRCELLPSLKLSP